MIVIIGILAAIAIPMFLGQRERAKNASAVEGGRTIMIAVLTYAARQDERRHVAGVGGQGAAGSVRRHHRSRVAGGPVRRRRRHAAGVRSGRHHAGALPVPRSARPRADRTSSARGVPRRRGPRSSSRERRCRSDTPDRDRSARRHRGRLRPAHRQLPQRLGLAVGARGEHLARVARTARSAAIRSAPTTTSRSSAGCCCAAAVATAARRSAGAIRWVRRSWLRSSSASC